MSEKAIPAVAPAPQGLWIPRLSSRVWAVWRRDFDVFRRLFWVNFALPMLEPILYLLALGFGLGDFIQEIQGIPYSRFIAPALVSVAFMYGAFFECSYASFVRSSTRRPSMPSSPPRSTWRRWWRERSCGGPPAPPSTAPWSSW